MSQTNSKSIKHQKINPERKQEPFLRSSSSLLWSSEVGRASAGQQGHNQTSVFPGGSWPLSVSRPHHQLHPLRAVIPSPLGIANLLLSAGIRDTSVPSHKGTVASPLLSRVSGLSPHMCSQGNHKQQITKKKTKHTVKINSFLLQIIRDIIVFSIPGVTKTYYPCEKFSLIHIFVNPNFLKPTKEFQMHHATRILLLIKHI